MGEKLKQISKYNKKDKIKLIILVVILVAIVGITIYLLPWIISLKDQSVRDALIEYIHSKGAWGVLILIGLQILQVILAFIPGEPIEVMCGLLYGTIGGYVICTVGIMLGTIIVYYTVRMLGYSFINRLVGEGKLSKFKFLQNQKKLEWVTFLFFFIPGTPKDFLTYFMPFTKIKPSKLFLIVAVARIPSIVSSTFAGASISEGKWIQTIVIFIVIGVIGILGIVFNEAVIKKLNDKKQKIKDKINTHYEK